MRTLLLLPLLAFLVGCYIEPARPASTFVAAQPVYAQPAQQTTYAGSSGPPASELSTFMAFAARDGRSNVQRADIRMQTTSWEPVPTVIQTSTSGPFYRTRPARILLAGDSAGTQASPIDNFVLVEIPDANNTTLSTGLIGNTEPAILNGRAVRQYGPQSFTPAPTDITDLFPSGNVPFYVRVSALDYGGGTYTSDMWVAVEGVSAMTTLGPPPLQSVQLVHARQGRTNAQRTDIQMQTTSWERTPTIIDTTQTDLMTLNAP